MPRKRSRLVLTLLTVTALGAALTFAFWPRPMVVDIGQVTSGPMAVTIDEEGRTRVHDTYVVSTPVEGRLLRVEVEPGDEVARGESVVARMLPSNPSALDVRTREQARTAVAAAEAALRLARAELNRAIADKELADTELKRTWRLRDQNTVSQAALDRVLREARTTQASLDTAEAAIAVREADLANVRARLISFDDEGVAGETGPGGGEFSIRAPASGRVLRVMQQSETTLPAGTPIMEIGNIDSDLEVLVDLLSTDAVQVSRGDRVKIVDWGGREALDGVVARVDPWGFTKFSALGVEEQRVHAVIRFVEAGQNLAGLGHGFRVEVKIVVWEQSVAVIVPSSALFRDGESWAVFRVEEGVAMPRQVRIGRNNGVQAQVLGGLVLGDQVVLFPSSALVDGTAVEQRILE